MTTTTSPTTTQTAPTPNRLRIGSSRWAMPVLAVLGGLFVLSLARVIADAPDMTAGDTFVATIAFGSPIVLAALAGLYSERVGVVNIGLEGMMVLGTWFAGFCGWHWGPWAALVGGAFGGMLGGLLHALATVTFNVDHIVSGIAINLIAPGVTRFLSSEVFVNNADGSITQSPTMSGTMGRFTVPFLAGGSLFGWKTPDPLKWLDDKRWFLISDTAGLLRGAFYNMAFSTMIAWLMVPVAAYLLWRTPVGLRMRSIGEKPGAAESLGVNVYRLKYLGVTLSGIMAGLGGAWLAIDIRAYNQDQVAGRGFQGLAAMIFGNYRPAGLAGGAGLFAYSQSLTQRIGTAPVRGLFLVIALLFAIVMIRSIVLKKSKQSLISAAAAFGVFVFYWTTREVNSKLVFITPYLVVLLVLAMTSQRLRVPAADGKPWRKGQIE